MALDASTDSNYEHGLIRKAINSAERNGFRYTIGNVLKGIIFISGIFRKEMACLMSDDD